MFSFYLFIFLMISRNLAFVEKKRNICQSSGSGKGGWRHLWETFEGCRDNENNSPSAIFTLYPYFKELGYFETGVQLTFLFIQLYNCYVHIHLPVYLGVVGRFTRKKTIESVKIPDLRAPLCMKLDFFFIFIVGFLCPCLHPLPKEPIETVN